MRWLVLPIRFLKLGHNVQLRENISFASPAPSWTVPSYNSLQDFSATCWYTGRAMHNLQPTDAKTPIGLIEASWGGTIIVSTAGLRLTRSNHSAAYAATDAAAMLRRRGSRSRTSTRARTATAKTMSTATVLPSGSVIAPTSPCPTSSPEASGTERLHRSQT